MEGLAELYSRRILELASSIPHTTPLVHPQARVLKHSRLCGSSIEVCVVMSVETTGIRERKPWLKDNFRVTEFSQDVKACVFGQASAAILGRNLLGQTYESVQHVYESVCHMLCGDDIVDGLAWKDLDVLEAAKEYPNRHNSLLLPFEATLEAISKARQFICKTQHLPDA